MSKDISFNSLTKSYSTVIKENLKDKIEIEIGDSKDSTSFQPQVKIMRWDNEVNFSMRFLDNSSSGSQLYSLNSGTIEYQKDDYKARFYEKPNISENGGYEFEIEIPKKPKTNELIFSINSKGLDLFRQPSFEEQYKNGYNNEIKREIIVSPTQVRDLDGNILFEQSEQNINSYVAYHKTKGGLNSSEGYDYKTGKAFHIFRPQVIDKNGNSIFGSIEVGSQYGTITLDSNWIGSASYPIVIDPTFGLTSVGAGTSSVWGNNKAQYSIFTNGTSTGTVGKMSVYGGTFAPVSWVQLGVGTKNGTVSTTIGTSNIQSNLGGTPPSWKNFSFSNSLTVNASTDYELIYGAGTGQCKINYDITGGNFWFGAGTGTSIQATDNLGTAGNDYNLSIYCTYYGTNESDTSNLTNNSDCAFTYSLTGNTFIGGTQAANLRVGFRDGTAFGTIVTGVLFSNVLIPQGATINSGTFFYTAFDTDAVTPNINIFAENVDTSTSYGTAAPNRPIDRSLTSNHVNWVMGTQVIGSIYSSPDISTVISEVVNRGGWTSGNKLSIILKNNSGTVNHNANASIIKFELYASFTAGTGTPGTVFISGWRNLLGVGL